MGVDKVLHTASNHINTNKTDAQNSPTMLSKIRSRVGRFSVSGVRHVTVAELFVNLRRKELLDEFPNNPRFANCSQKSGFFSHQAVRMHPNATA